jgi:hypothetical protein
MFDKDEFYETLKEGHYSCEDLWYNCPAHEEAYNKYDEKDWKRECECGADRKNRKISDISKLIEAEISDLCNALCGVLDQGLGSKFDGSGEYRTIYNHDAIAVDLLEKHGYVEITDGKWPQTKYLTFKFTEKRKV